MKKILFTLICVMFVAMATISAQKIDQVNEWLGDYRFNNEKPAGAVVFVFEEGKMTRVGNGKRSWNNLLQSQSGFADDSGGNLISITLNGDRVKKGGRAPKARTRSNNESDSNSDRPTSSSNRENKDSYYKFKLDSMSLVLKLEEAKAKTQEGIREVSKVATPIWGWVKWFFHIVLVVLLGLLGITHFIARAIRNETIYIVSQGWFGPHLQKALFTSTTVALICAMTIMIFMLINIYIALIDWFGWDTYISLGLVSICFLICIRFAAWITDKLVPNMRHILPSGNNNGHQHP